MKYVHIGSGECGSNIVNSLHKKYGYICKTINSSRKDHEKAIDIEDTNKILLKNTYGLAKKMEAARDLIKEQGLDILKQLIIPELDDDETTRFILHSSSGGGTGAGMTLELARVMKANLPSNVKISVFLTTPFEFDDSRAFRNTIACISFFEAMGIPTRIISNSNFLSREGLTESTMHQKINNYIIDSIHGILSSPQAPSLGINTDEEEVDQVMFDTPGYLFVAKISLSNKHKDKNNQKIISGIKASLDMGFNFDGYYEKRLMILSATEGIAAEIDRKALDEELGTADDVSFFTHIKPVDSENYMIVVLSGCNFPNQIVELEKKVNKGSNKKKSLGINLDILTPTVHEDVKDTSSDVYSKLFAGLDNKKTSDSNKKGLKDDIIKSVDAWDL